MASGSWASPLRSAPWRLLSVRTRARRVRFLLLLLRSCVYEIAIITHPTPYRAPPLLPTRPARCPLPAALAGQGAGTAGELCGAIAAAFLVVTGEAVEVLPSLPLHTHAYPTIIQSC